jgi:hypothetical protein
MQKRNSIVTTKRFYSNRIFVPGAEREREFPTTKVGSLVQGEGEKCGQNVRFVRPSFRPGFSQHSTVQYIDDHLKCHSFRS